MLAICCVFAMISVLGSLTTFSLFVKPVQKGLGLNRTEIMSGFTIMLAMFALGAPLAGRLLDRLSTKKVMVPAALLSISGLILLSRTTALWQFFLGYCLVGMGSTTTGPVGSSYVVSHWFRRRRGMAVGTMSAGMTFGGVAIAPLMAVYVIPALGWRAAYAILAGLTAVVVLPLALFVLRAKPADLGLFPDGDDGPDQGNGGSTEPKHEGIPLRRAVTTSAFWLMGISLVCNHTHLGVMQNAFPHLCDLAFPVATVALVNSVTYGFVCMGMFSFGLFCDYLPPKYAAALGLLLIAVGIALLLHVTALSSPAFLYCYAAVFGFGMGSWMPTMSMLTSRTFGMASYGTIFGLMALFQNVGGGIGPLIAGRSYDATHAYGWGFVTIVILVLIAIPLVLLVPKHVPWEMSASTDMSET